MEKFAKTAMWLCIGALAVLTTIVVAKAITFDIECEGHIKLAADANSIELAKTELKTAIDYAEAHGLTEGYTSVWFRVPTDNLAFWYNNMTSAYKELCDLPTDATPLEKTNVLMKLRETLLDSGEKGDVVTHPDGISVYPHNKAYAYTALGFFGLMVLFMVLLFYGWDIEYWWRNRN